MEKPQDKPITIEIRSLTPDDHFRLQRLLKSMSQKDSELFYTETVFIGEQFSKGFVIRCKDVFKARRLRDWLASKTNIAAEYKIKE